MEPLLRLTQVKKRFGGIEALKGIDFDVYPGEVHALVGENGAGKSTMMKILAGVIPDYAGEMAYKGRPLRLKNPKEALDLGIAMIHQELSVMPELSVAENIFLGRQPTRGRVVDWRRMNAEARRILEALGYPQVEVERPLGDYPLGVHQLAEIARALTSGAELIIMDEPTSALSPMETERLLALVRRLAEQGKAIVYISHFLEEVTAVADRVTVLRDGEKVATLRAEETDKSELVRLMLGREAQFFERAELAPRARAGEPALELFGLSRPRAFEGVDLAIYPGEIVGLYGLIGSGHFELAETVFGLARPNAGQIRVAGKPLRGGPRRAIREGLAYVPPSRRTGLFLEKPVYQNVSLPWLDRLFGPLRELAAAREVTHQVGLRPPDPTRDVGAFSGGNQQKVAIARWLVEPPKVFLASEPTRGMDVGAKDEVLSILRRMADAGTAVLLVSSEPETILAAADRILVMAKGRIVAEYTSGEVTKEMLVHDAAGKLKKTA